MALTEFEGSSLDAQKAFYVPVGAASPLWFMFAGAATAGMAYWWMTRWADRTHLEAVLGSVELPVMTEPPAPEPVVEVFVPVATAVEAVVEAVTETAAVVEDNAVVEAEPAKTRAKTRSATEPPAA